MISPSNLEVQRTDALTKSSAIDELNDQRGNDTPKPKEHKHTGLDGSWHVNTKTREPQTHLELTIHDFGNGSLVIIFLN